MKYLYLLGLVLPLFTLVRVLLAMTMPASQSAVAVTTTLSPTSTATVTPRPTNTPQPTDTPIPILSPTPNGGGEYIAFSVIPPFSKSSSIYIMKSDGSNPHVISGDKSWLINHTWSPDASKIAFGYDDYYATHRGPLYMVNVDGSNLHKLEGASGDFAWSPDSTQVASIIADKDGYEIFITNIAGDKSRPLTDNDLAEAYPTWSPDGHQIAFDAYLFDIDNPSKNEDRDIYLIDVDGSNLRQLTDNNVAEFDPIWSPDGKNIAFITSQNGFFEIYIMNADGGNLHNVSNHEAEDKCPAWSPDGKQLLFVSNRDGDGEVYAVNIDGNNPRNLTKNKAYDSCASWSPDGTQIVFSSDRIEPNDAEIYVMNSNGSNIRRLTNHEGADFEPIWQPSP